MNNQKIQWKRVRIKDICLLTTGKKAASDAKVDGKYTFYDASKKSKKIDVFSKYGKAILFAIRGSNCARNVQLNKKGGFEFSKLSACLIPLPNTDVNFNFLFFCLKGNLYDFCCRSAAITKTTIEMLTIESLKNIELLIPMDLLYQERVCEYLELQMNDIQALIKTHSKQVELAQKLKKSLIYEHTNKLWNKNDSISWIKTRLKLLCSLSIGNKLSGEANKNGKYLLYSGAQQIKKTNTFSKHGPAILLCVRGSNCGKYIEYNKHEAFDYTNASACLELLPNSPLSLNYLCFWLRGNFYHVCSKYGYINKTTFDMLTLDSIRNLEIIMPKNVYDQNRLAGELESCVNVIDFFIDLLKKSIEKLKNFKFSLIQDLTLKQTFN